MTPERLRLLNAAAGNDPNLGAAGLYAKPEPEPKPRKPTKKKPTKKRGE